MQQLLLDCRSCSSPELAEFLNLGDQHISDFREDTALPPKYPLLALLCTSCGLVQLDRSVPQSEMYHENYGFKSGVSDSIKKDLDEIVTEAFQWVNDPKDWLDIACNDGTLLSFVPEDVYRVGIDPVGFLSKEARVHADRVVTDYFRPEPFGYYDPMDGHWQVDQFDVITSISCFYDMPDPNKFVRDVKSILSHKGVWIIQQNYLLTTLQLGAVDNFCHEHLTYFTLHSLEHLLERHGLEVVDLSTSMVNGGSIRTVVAHKGVFPVQDSVARQRIVEEDAGVLQLDTYTKFAVKAMEGLAGLRLLVERLVDQGNKIFILAASTRGATIWQAAGIGPALVSKAVERNPAKVGKWFSAIGIPIISEEEARENRPDYMIIGPWFFAGEIVAREQDYLDNGGKLIVPLPELRIVDGD